MADLNTPVLGNYRRYISPSLGEFDVNMMMEKAASLSFKEMKEMKVRVSGKDSCTVDISPDNDKNIRMFRQRAQVDSGGKL